jgi:hypothetical protein
MTSNPIDRAIFTDSLNIALAGGCGLCDTENTHMCAACGRCNCHDHTTCTRPNNDRAPFNHTIQCVRGPETVSATSHVPGLLVYRIPAHVDIPSPHRWRLGHHTGLVIATALSEHEAHAGAHEIADRADWTQDKAAIRRQVPDFAGMYEDLAAVGCQLPDPA